MDIEYLLFLQNLRGYLGGIFDSFFAFVTQIAVPFYIILIPLYIYWTIDKKKGLFIYCTYGLGNYFNALLKSTFCVYRPWIRDPRVKPLDSVISGATGYSFPSGHATNAGSTYLPLAHKYKKHKALVVMCMIMIVLTMFSRNFVGVHTLSDVLVGMLIGIVSLFIIIKVEKYIEDNPNKDIYVLIFATLMVIGILLYVSFKSYPMDYVDGQLLVDPEKMKRNSFTCPGLFYGTVIAWFLERRYLKLDISGTKYQKIMRIVIGTILLVAWSNIIVSGIGGIINTHLFSFILQVFEPIIFIFVYPLTWKKLHLK